MYAIRSGTNAIELEKSFPLKDMDFLGGNTYAIAGPEGVSLFSRKILYQSQYSRNCYQWFD